MKNIIRTISLVTVFTIAAGNIQAQETKTEARNKAEFGLKAGVNYSNVYSAEGEEFVARAKLGFVGGAFMFIPILQNIGFQPELLYSQKGFQATGRILGETYDFKRTTSYIDIPLFVAFKPIDFMTLVAGPQYSYLVRQKDVFATAASSIAQEEEFKNDDIRKNTFCFVFGGDINIQHLVIGVRAGWDALNNNGDGGSATPQYKNVWLQTTVGYRFYH